MSIRQMEYMLAIAAHRNISLAAEACFISQSALSQSLSKLEQALEVRLFDRSGNAWLPTRAGSLYLETAEKIVALHRQMLLDIGNSRKAGETIRLGMTFERSSVLFPVVYSLFREEYPGIPLQLVEEHSYSLQKMVMQGNLSMILAVLPAEDREQERQQIVCEDSETEELVLIVPPSHPFAERYRADPDDIPGVPELAGENFIGHSRNKSLRRIVDAALTEAPPQDHLEVKSTTTVTEFVSQGIGIAIVPKMFAAGPHGVKIVPMKTPVFWEVGVMRRRGRSFSEPEKRLAAIIMEEFRRLLRE